jgi:hypothetical protein
MTEEQADTIISLLKDIRDCLTDIDSNTSDISSIESNTSKTVSMLRNLK